MLQDDSDDDGQGRPFSANDPIEARVAALRQLSIREASTPPDPKLVERVAALRHVSAQETGFANYAAAEVDPQLEARIAALRQLSTTDTVRAIREVVLSCQNGQEVIFPRYTGGVGGILKKRNVRLHFVVPSESAVQEAAVVLATTLAATVPAAQWRVTRVLELGCGAGFVGLTLATLGAQVVLTDYQEMETVALDSIARNAPKIKPPGCCRYMPLDWSEPRASSSASAAVAESHFIFASDPATDVESMKNFISMLGAILGLDGGRPIVPGPVGIVVAHKHRPCVCTGGYCPPMEGAPPPVTSVEEGDMCLFRRNMEDLGLVVVPWRAPPKDFEHPFVECWRISLPTPSS